MKHREEQSNNCDHKSDNSAPIGEEHRQADREALSAFELSGGKIHCGNTKNIYASCGESNGSRAARGTEPEEHKRDCVLAGFVTFVHGGVFVCLTSSRLRAVSP